MKSQRGFSLVGTLVGAAVSAVVLMGIVEFIGVTNKGQKNVQNSIEFDIVKTNLLLVLAKSTLCASGFRAKDETHAAKYHPTLPIATDDRVHSIRAGGSTLLKLGQNLPGGLKVSKIQFQPVSGAAPGPYEVSLVVEIEKSGAAMGAQILSNAANPFLVTLQTNASNRIIGCGVSGSTVAGTICGGYVTKYPGGWCSSCTYSKFGCGLSGSCPSGYTSTPVSYVTINNAENTWLCVKN